MTKLCILGCGLMGSPMSRRLLAAGFSVTVWNRTRAKAQALQAAGARVADTPFEAAGRSLRARPLASSPARW